METLIVDDKKNTPLVSWQPIAVAREIKKDRAYAVTYKNKPLVIFRNDNREISILDDWCPHRFAPLSRGKIIQGEIQCPYHGWQFNGAGVCTRVPGLSQKKCESSIVKSYSIIEQQGLVWFCNTEKLPEFNGVLAAHQRQELDCFYIQDSVRTDLHSLIENFLDGFHTHFVHAGIVRKDQGRQMLDAEIHSLPDGIEVTYSGEKNQNGFISQFLEPERGVSLARFRLPNFAEIEYRGVKNQLNLLVSFWAVEAKKEEFSVFVRVATPKGFWPVWVKNKFLSVLFKKVLQQDKQILEMAQENKYRFLERQISLPIQLNTHLDLFHPWLEKIIDIQAPVHFPSKVIRINL